MEADDAPSEVASEGGGADEIFSDRERARSLLGTPVVDVSGTKVGKRADVYVDEARGAAAWLLVSTGLFGSNNSFVPVKGATVGGGAVRVPWGAELIKSAPRAEPNALLTSDEEEALYEHYGLTVEQNPARRQEVTGEDPSEAMVRSEEEVRLHKERRPARRARLRKYVLTEEVTITVPLRREVVELEYEPVGEAEREAGRTAGELPDPGGEPMAFDDDIVVLLHEERLVIDKQVVPRERVRLKKDVVVEERRVATKVRKERVAYRDVARGENRPATLGE